MIKVYGEAVEPEKEESGRIFERSVYLHFRLGGIQRRLAVTLAGLQKEALNVCRRHVETKD